MTIDIWPLRDGYSWACVFKNRYITSEAKGELLAHLHSEGVTHVRYPVWIYGEKQERYRTDEITPADEITPGLQTN